MDVSKLGVPSLDGRKSYRDWATAVRAQLQVKGLWSYVESAAAADKSKISAEEMQGRMKALGIIVLTIDRNIRERWRLISDPYDLFRELADTYGKADPSEGAAKLAQLLMLKASASESVNLFYTRILTLTSEITASGIAVSDEVIISRLINGFDREYEIIALQRAAQPQGKRWKVTEVLTHMEVLEATRALSVTGVQNGGGGRGQQAQALWNRGVPNDATHHAPNAPPRKETRRCFNCNKKGHIARDCRKPKKAHPTRTNKEAQPSKAT